jgi:hypothetical protein
MDLERMAVRAPRTEYAVRDRTANTYCPRLDRPCGVSRIGGCCGCRRTGLPPEACRYGFSESRW